MEVEIPERKNIEQPKILLMDMVNDEGTRIGSGRL